jgi:uncharacterized membrane protein YhaH (DUF805 family)
MTFPDAVRRCFVLYATFTGRARRSEFWFFCLFNLLAHGVAGILDAAVFDGWSPLNAVVSLLLVVPHLAVSVRRLHDVGRSGWWVLILFVPLVGIVALLVWYTSRGEDGTNRFGPDPRGGDMPGGGTGGGPGGGAGAPGRPWPVGR